MAIMAMTTNSSIRVKPPRLCFCMTRMLNQAYLRGALDGPIAPRGLIHLRSLKYCGWGVRLTLTVDKPLVTPGVMFTGDHCGGPRLELDSSVNPLADALHETFKLFPARTT